MKFLLKVVVSCFIILLLVGTISYNYLEGWNYVDSLYFTTMILTTIGHPNLYPTTDISKVFTVFFSIIGIVIAIFSIYIVSAAYFEHRSRTMRNKNRIRRKRRLIKHRKNPD